MRGTHGDKYITPLLIQQGVRKFVDLDVAVWGKWNKRDIDGLKLDHKTLKAISLKFSGVVSHFGRFDFVMLMV